LEAPFSGLKIAKTKNGDINFLVNSLAYQNGSAYNPELAPKPRHSGRVYENIYPRHWDRWLTKERYQVFGGTVKSNSSYSQPRSGLHNFLKDVNFTLTRPESPVQPFGDQGDYDISPDGEMIAFLTKAPQLNKANYTASYIYLGPFDGSSVPEAINGPDSEADAAGHKGASGKPTFSPDGSKLAFIQQDGDYYESDRWQLYLVDVSKGSEGIATSNYQALTPDWDRWVDSIHWAPNGESIFVTAEDFALERVFNIPLSSAGEGFEPKNLTAVTTVSGFSVLPDSSLLVSSSSVWTTRDFSIVTNGTQKTLFSATEADEQLAGLGPHTYSEIFYTGSLGLEQKLHAMVVKPSNFSPNKTYPLAYIIHGGPQGSNANAWSQRWNFQLWADQGYVVVAPNPVGSTGFGQYLTDVIQGDWGGAPYEDIVLGWEYVKENLPFVDTDNGIVAGASYGGFMTNWIQGHDFGREFKAIVTHDGISQTLGAYQTEELWFMRHDFNGSIYDAEAVYDKWNPMNHIANWSTPQFVIHNTLDYRLPESDGLGLFNILQSKGIPSRFLNFPDEHHQVVGKENALFWYSEVFNWVNHWSKGQELDSEAIGE
jgi:dipeptidyl aminopeptidase/acylaminoacyl peptidase